MGVVITSTEGGWIRGKEVGVDCVALEVLIRTWGFALTDKGRALEDFEHSDVSCLILKGLLRLLG